MIVIISILGENIGSIVSRPDQVFKKTATTARAVVKWKITVAPLFFAEVDFGH
jgi:hypothetical protein